MNPGNPPADINPGNQDASKAYIVGIGTSAGGLEALNEFFQHLPPDSGMAFVVVQHLSPDFKTMMPELLAGQTTMEICLISAPVSVRPNTIYLAPSDQQVLMNNGLLIPVPREHTTVPGTINRFFSSLAKDRGHHAIGVILSGTGADGSLGVMEIDAAGGRVLVQSPETATFDGMPANAIASEVADVIAAPGELARQLLASGNNNDLSNQLTHHINNPGGENFDLDLQQIFRLVKDHFDLDLSAYKLPTLLRRLERRMSMLNKDSVPLYLEVLKTEPAELQNFYKDLLIGVSAFFRDLEAFQYLEYELLPNLLANHSPGAELRIWVAACSTGEEAYSLAITLKETLQKLNLVAKCKIFATDINTDSLKIASEGIYSGSALQAVPAGIQAKYFTENDNGQYQVVPAIRNMILFSRHNLLTDIPVHKIDLLSCRNLLIYLQPAAQKRVLGSLHFSLNMNGTLWLGQSESLGDLERDFEATNSRWKYFTKTGRHRPLLTLESVRLNHTRSDGPSTTDLRINRLYDQLLERHMPPAVLIDEKRQLLHVIGSAHQYLHPPEGRVSNDLVQLLRGNLKAAVTTLAHSAKSKNQDIQLNNIQIGPNPDDTISLCAEHYVDSASKSRFLLIRFIPPETPTPDHQQLLTESACPQATNFDKRTDGQTRHLEQELQDTRLALHTLMQDMDSTNEDLQSSNEELMASNEELQSTNEELYSVNEELYNVNAELQEKIRQLAQTSSDIQNLVANSNTGIIITDEMHQLRLFTPLVSEIYNILPQDIGRPVSHITSKIGDTTLAHSLTQVTEQSPTHTQTLTTTDNRFFLRTISAYSETDSTISCYIIVFTDITVQEQAKRTAIRHEQNLRQITDSLKLFVWVDDADGNNVYTNHCMQHYTGLSGPELSGHGYLRIIHPMDRARIRNAWQNCLHTGQDLDAICRYQRFDEVYRWFRIEATPIRNSEGVIHQWVGSCTDINESKGVMEQLNTLIQNAPVAIIIVDELGNITLSNRKTTLWFGYSEAELEDQPVSILFSEQQGQIQSTSIKSFLQPHETRSIYSSQIAEGRRKSGETFPLEIGMSPVELLGKRHVATFITDITLRNQAESALQQINDSLEHAIEQRSRQLVESQNRLKLAANAAKIGIFDFDAASKQVTYDQAMFAIMGITPTQNMSINYELWRSCVLKDDLAVQDRILADAQLNNRTDYSSTYRIHRYDTGELRHISSNRNVIMDENGTVSRIVGVIRDITDTYLAEKSSRSLAQNLEYQVNQCTLQLAKSEDRFRRMADVSPVLFWIGDAKGRLSWINTTWQNWTGRTNEDETGERWLAHVHPDDKAMVKAQLASHFNTGEQVALEYRLLNSQNTYGWLFHQGSALLSDQHEIEGFIATCTDISWQKERNEEQQRIERKMEEATKLDSLGLMAGGVAHDFNNLLTGILGNIELAQWETGGEQEMLRTVLNDARSATLRAADLCKQMLAYSGKGQFLTENCDVNSLVRETLRFIQTSIKDDVKVFTELQPSLPPVIADKVQLQQIIMNLTINAGESIADKGTLWIRTGTTRMEIEDKSSFVYPETSATGAGIFIEVEDTGSGMTPEEIKKAFEPFYTTKFIGRGLGLSAVQGIIKGHHGQLIINSIKGAGTLMRVVLPLQAPGIDQPKARLTDNRTVWINRVLIVDDEEIVARILQRYLDHQCIEADYVLNGKDCINRLIGNPDAYDLILLDLTMAGMDGYETFRQIRQINRKVNVILISGFTEKEATRQFDINDLAGFLPKPISEKTLVDMIRHLKK